MTRISRQQQSLMAWRREKIRISSNQWWGWWRKELDRQQSGRSDAETFLRSDNAHILVIMCPGFSGMCLEFQMFQSTVLAKSSEFQNICAKITVPRCYLSHTTVPQNLLPENVSCFIIIIIFKSHNQQGKVNLGKKQELHHLTHHGNQVVRKADGAVPKNGGYVVLTVNPFT